MNDQLFAQFHALPASVKNVVSSAEGMAVMEALEERYGVVLAEFILRLIVRDLSWSAFAKTLQEQQSMAPDQALSLARELEQGLLAPLMSYLQSQLPTTNHQPPTIVPQTSEGNGGRLSCGAGPDFAGQTTKETQTLKVGRQGIDHDNHPVPQRTESVVPPNAPAAVPTSVPRINVPDALPHMPVAKKPMPAPPQNLPVQPTANIQQPTFNSQRTGPPVKSPAVSQKPGLSSVPVLAPDSEIQSVPGIALQQLERGRKSEYFMSAEDEEEVGQHRKRLATFAAPVALSEEIEKSITALIAKFHLTFAAPALERRFRAIVASGLHNARSRTALQEMLQRPAKIGGMRYDARLAEQVAAEADKQAVLLHDLRILTQPSAISGQPRTSVPQTTEVTGDRLSGKAGPGFAGQITNYELQKEGQLVAPSQTPVPTKQEPIPAQRAPEPLVAPATIIPLAPTVPSTQQEQAVPARQPIARRLQATPDPDRPFLQDIRHPAKPMDLADELGALTMQDFRKLGSTAEAAQKVLQKVALLTEESFLRRSEGIRQWRESDVCQQYLGIGRDSMISGKTVEQIIDDRQRQNVPTLSLEEFTAIADLNRQMRL